MTRTRNYEKGTKKGCKFDKNEKGGRAIKGANCNFDEMIINYIIFRGANISFAIHVRVWVGRAEPEEMWTV